MKDHLGSTRAVTDQHNAILATFDYYPFGLLMLDRYTIANNTTEKFTGKQLDKNLNLYYFGARYLDPAIGRWLVVDPLLNEMTPNKLLEKDMRYLSQSPYNYVHNNPLRYVDPDGKQIDAIKNTFRTFWKGMQDQFTKKVGLNNNPRVNRINANRFNPKNSVRVAGARTVDVLSNTYSEPYISISVSKGAAISGNSFASLCRDNFN